MTAVPETPDNQIELAKERNRIAADRTLLTWVRTSISFIGMGFGISQVLNFLVSKHQIRFTPALNPDLLGLVVIGLGVLIAIAAALDYQRELSRLHQTIYVYQPRLSLGLIVGSAVVILSLVALGVIWNEPLLA